MLKRIALVALLGISLAGAKTFTFTMSDSAQAGNAKLTPGEYTVKLDGSQAVITDRAGHRIDAPAKVETSDRKFEQTAVSISKVNGANRIQSIQLGGSKSKLVFE